MKRKLLLLFASCCISAAATAQLAPGNLLLGGNLNLHLNHGKTLGMPQQRIRTTSSLGVNPHIGYFFTPRLVVGLAVGYGAQWEEEQNNYTVYKNRDQSFSVGPFARYYHMFSEKAGIFGHGSVGYSRGNYKNWREAEGWRRTQTSSSAHASLQPGFTYFLHTNLGAEITFGRLGYSTVRYENPTNYREATTNRFDFDLGLRTFAFGFSYYVNR